MTSPNRTAPALSNARVVAIDGGTGTGKSRLGMELAQLLHLKGVPALFISTGYLYRAVTWVALEDSGRKSVDERVERVRAMDEAKLLSLVERHQIDMHGGNAWIDEAVAQVDTQLKAPGVGRAIPHVASFLGVRQIVNAAARRQINEFDGFVLVEGRDIGHTVVPEASLRILLAVTPEVAASRSPEHTVDEVIARDTRDRAHVHGALKSPDDAGAYTHVIWTDDHSPESIRDEVYGLMRKMFGNLPSL